MRLIRSLLFASAAAGMMMASNGLGQTPPPEPTQPPLAPSAPPPAPTPTPLAPLALPASAAAAGVAPSRLTDAPAVTTLKLPADNPFGANVEAPAILPPKPVFNLLAVPVSLFGAIRVDRAGKVIESRRVRDPIPSLQADTKKSFDRWSFDPARQAGQPVETWSSVRVDLSIEVRPPKIEQITLAPVTPSSPIPTPLEWGPDNVWYESLKVIPPSDGTVPVEQVEIPPTPKKTPWYADSFRGPFSCRLWVKVSAAGRIEKVIPLQVSDPVLIPYLRHELQNWATRPARISGQLADSWNELALSGTVGYSIEIKQILSLRKTIAGG